MENEYIADITAEVVEVGAKFIRLSSTQLSEGTCIMTSAVIACSALPTATIPIDACREFSPGDVLNLNVFRTGGDLQYKPLQINWIKRQRRDGDHIVADGIIIYTYEREHAIIRSRHIEKDVLCPISAFVNPVLENITFGRSVVVEAAIGEYRGVAARICPDNFGNVQIHRAPAMITRNLETGELVAQLKGRDPKLVTFYPGAFRQDGFSVDALLDESVICVLCPKTPMSGGGTLEYEVISVEPDFDAAVGPLDRLSMECIDGIQYKGISGRGNRMWHIQASKSFNGDQLDALRDAVVYLIDSMDPDIFEDLVTENANFFKKAMDEQILDLASILGLDSGDGGSQIIDDEASVAADTATLDYAASLLPVVQRNIDSIDLDKKDKPDIAIASARQRTDPIFVDLDDMPDVDVNLVKKRNENITSAKSEIIDSETSGNTPIAAPVISKASEIDQLYFPPAESRGQVWFFEKAQETDTISKSAENKSLVEIVCEASNGNNDENSVAEKKVENGVKLENGSLQGEAREEENFYGARAVAAAPQAPTADDTQKKNENEITEESGFEYYRRRMNLARNGQKVTRGNPG